MGYAYFSLYRCIYFCIGEEINNCTGVEVKDCTDVDNSMLKGEVKKVQKYFEILTQIHQKF